MSHSVSWLHHQIELVYRAITRRINVFDLGLLGCPSKYMRGTRSHWADIASYRSALSLHVKSVVD